MKLTESQIIEKVLAGEPLDEAIPMDVSKAARQVMSSMAKFMKDYAVFEKAVLPASGEYGEKLKALPKSKLGGYDQKKLTALKKQYAELREKWSQFDVSVWALHLR